MTLDQVRSLAYSRGIEIDDVPMKAIRAVSFPEGWIAIDSRKFQSEVEYKCELAHEIGHCITGSFYNIHTQASERRLSERQANRFAAEMLVPFSELRKAMQRGITFNRILAKMFEVTVEFIDMVLELFEGELVSFMRRIINWREHHEAHSRIRAGFDAVRRCAGGHDAFNVHVRARADGS